MKTRVCNRNEENFAIILSLRSIDRGKEEGLEIPRRARTFIANKPTRENIKRYLYFCCDFWAENFIRCGQDEFVSCIDVWERWWIHRPRVLDKILNGEEALLGPTSYANPFNGEPQHRIYWFYVIINVWNIQFYWMPLIFKKLH